MKSLLNPSEGGETLRVFFDETAYKKDHIYYLPSPCA